MLATRCVTRSWGPLACALLIGCGGASPGEPVDTDVSDDTGPPDTDDTDIPDTDEPGDTDTDDTAEPDLPDDGYLSVVWMRPDHGAPEAYLVGQLYEELEPGVAAVDFARPAHVDDCALTLYTVEQLSQGTLPTHRYESAGSITLAPPAGAAVTVTMGSGNLYYRYIDPAAVPLGEAYQVDAPGNTFPAFTGRLDLPSPRQLLAPLPGFSASGALAVQWSGGDPGELRIRVESQDAEGHRGHIHCRVTNDGQHTVPAALMDQLPGDRATLHFEQVHRTDLEVDGRWIWLTGAVVDIVVGGGS